jgi:PAS domain S-box-containing protein
VAAVAVITQAQKVQVLTGESATYALEKRYVRKDGRVIWVLLSGSLVRDELGAPRYYLSLIQDITERRGAEAERPATHSNTLQVLERITDGFYALDRDWHFTYVNSTAERMLGRTRAELLGQNIWEAFPVAVENPVYTSYVQAMDEGVTTTVEFFYPPFAAWFEARAHPSPNGLSVFFTEITGRKHVEQVVDAALAAAQAANDASRQFLTVMSHELGTPIQVILGYAELLQQGADGLLSSDQMEHVQTIQRAANRLAALEKQMLDLSRLETRQIKLAVTLVSLAPIIAEVGQELAPEATAKGLDLDINLPPELPPVLGDVMAIYQILLNLVGNAVTFTEVGIAPDALAHIFDEFRQVEPGRIRRHDGAGLALTLTRRLTELMGGRLSIESRLNGGSTFRLHLVTAGYIAGSALNHG